MEGAAAGRHFDGHELGLDAVSGGGLKQFGVRVRRPVELLDHSPAPVPTVRAAHVLDRALGRGGVLEGDPAADPFRGNGPLFVARILVEAEGFAARRLPQHVVLTQARAAPPAEAGAGTSDIRPQHNPGDLAIGLPSIADLAGEIGRVDARPPVPFVGIEAGLEPAGEQILVAVQSPPGQGGVDQAFNDHEAVASEGLGLVVGQLE